MPDIVAHGKKPEVRACSLCHYPNGKGRAENAGVSGLNNAYFIQQMMDFRNGDRKSAEPRKANTNAMIAIAKGMTEDEIKQAAEYFGAIKWTTPWIKVVESKTAPKTRIQGGLFLALEGDEKEPLGQRIIEVPVNAEATEVLRDPHSGFIAYAPVGSIKKGEALAKTKQCAVCHGADLKGIGPVPSIAGRSPSYLMRQMYDMQHGRAQGLVDRADEAGGRESERRRSAGAFGLRCFADAVGNEDRYVKKFGMVCTRLALSGLLAAETLTPPTAAQRTPRASNMDLVGYNDLQSRSAYQPVIQKQGDRWIAYIGHHGGEAMNPQTGKMEPNGTSIVDVTDPKHPKYLIHIPGRAERPRGRIRRRVHGARVQRQRPAAWRQRQVLSAARFRQQRA